MPTQEPNPPALEGSEMDYNKVALVVCLTLFIVVGVNAAIYVTLRRRNEVSQIELLRRAAKTARQPWQSEDEDLRRLAEMVKGLRQSEGENKGQDEPR